MALNILEHSMCRMCAISVLFFLSFCLFIIFVMQNKSQKMELFTKRDFNINLHILNLYFLVSAINNVIMLM